MDAQKDEPAGEITRRLQHWTRGDSDGLNDLVDLIYTELKAMAVRQCLRARPGDTLQPTVLVHEVYLKVVKATGLSFENRYAFFAFAGLLMRQTLVDLMRRKNTDKRGAGVAVHSLQPDVDLPAIGATLSPERFLDLHRALDQLARRDKRQVELVHLRFFCGLQLDEIAAMARLSPTSVKKELRLAKHYLAGRLKPALPRVQHG